MGQLVPACALAFDTTGSMASAPARSTRLQVNTGGIGVGAVKELRGEAVMLTTANQMITTFQQIGTALSQLRIAK